MIERVFGQLPPWMRPRNPILRYSLGFRATEQHTRHRYRRLAVFILLLILLVASGYLIGSALSDESPLDKPVSQMLFETLFWPTFIVQVFLQIIAMGLTINTVAEEKRRQTWDSVKTTAEGAALAMRARWSAVIFYRIRPFLIIILLVRVILIAGILIDLTAFRGEYLNYLTGSITPDIPQAAGVVLLALTMTSTLLLPITAVGFDASIGLLVSTFVQQRTYVVLVQITLTVARLATIAFLLVAVTQFREGALWPGTSGLITWLLLFGFAVVSDWGLSLLYLGYYGAVVWAEVPYGIMLGVAMLTFVLVQAVLTDGIMALAIRRAERGE